MVQWFVRSCGPRGPWFSGRHGCASDGRASEGDSGAPAAAVPVTVVPVAVIRGAGHGCAGDGRAGDGGAGRACLRGAGHSCAGDGRASGGDGRAGARIDFKIQGTGTVTKPKLLVFLNVQATLDSECLQMYDKQYSF